ncbi:hypothetical protein HRbin16_01058 [bacterium HR16]|nr:hypothetical protein HRbin16_01058 [bacterium HR16]
MRTVYPVAKGDVQGVQRHVLTHKLCTIGSRLQAGDNTRTAVYASLHVRVCKLYRLSALGSGSLQECVGVAIRKAIRPVADGWHVLCGEAEGRLSILLSHYLHGQKVAGIVRYGRFDLAGGYGDDGNSALRPAQRVEHHDVRLAAHAPGDVLQVTLQHHAREFEAVAVIQLAGVATQPLAFVHIVMLSQQQVTPRLTNLPFRIHIPLRIRSAQHSRHHREAFRAEQLVLCLLAEVAHHVTVFTDGHAVEHVVQSVLQHRFFALRLSEKLAQRHPADIELGLGGYLFHARGYQLRPAHPVGGGEQLQPLDNQRVIHLLYRFVAQALFKVLGPLMQAEVGFGRHQYLRTVQSAPPRSRDPFDRDMRCVPRPLEKETTILEPAPSQNLGQLGEEVELLLPPGHGAHAKQFLAHQHAHHQLAHVRLAAAEQAVRLTIRRPHNLDASVPDRFLQQFERFGVGECQLFVAHHVEVHVALCACFVHQQQHIPHAGRKHKLSPVPYHVYPVFMIAEGVVYRSFR